MRLEDQQILLRVYLRNTDQYRWLSATDTIVERARRASARSSERPKASSGKRSWQLDPPGGGVKVPS